MIMILDNSLKVLLTQNGKIREWSNPKSKGKVEKFEFADYVAFLKNGVIDWYGEAKKINNTKRTG